MKPAYYMLAAALLALAVIGLPLMPGKGIMPSPPAEAGRAVYVDLDRLLLGHPALRSARALAGREFSSAEPRARVPSAHSYEGEVDRLVRTIGRTARERESAVRQQFELAAARAETAALAKLESDLLQALAARIRVRRVDMMASSAAQTDDLVRQVWREESEKRREAEERTAIERINAMLKISSLQAAIKVLGVREKALSGALISAKDEFVILEDKRAAQRKRIQDEAQEEISAIGRNAANKVAAELSDYEFAQRARIENGVNRARTAFLDALSDPVPPAESRMPEPDEVKASVGTSRLPTYSRRQTVSAESPLNDIRNSLRASLARCAVMVGRERGMRVMFARGRGVPDATDTMRRLLRERGLACWSTSIYTAGGS